MRTVFLRVLEAEDKAAALVGAVFEPERAKGRQRFVVDPRGFASVEGSPFSYWVSEKLRSLFKELPALEGEGRTAQVGVATGDDQRFVRAWWAGKQRSGARWLPFAKGGAFSPFYADLHLMVDWLQDGIPIEISFVGGRVRKVLFFRPGITWPRRTNGLSFRPIPAGCVFSDKSPTACEQTDSAPALLALAAVMNSRAFGFLVSLQLARTELAQSYEVGLIQATPVPKLTSNDQEVLAVLARRIWDLKRSLDTCSETSHAFTLPALLQVAGANLASCASTWSEHVRSVEREITTIQAEIDELCFALYDFDDSDRRAIVAGFSAMGTEKKSNNVEDDEDDVAGDLNENETMGDARILAVALVSWAICIAFGRFDVRLATGARPMPPEPEPFDPLPTCSPGMLTGADGLPLPLPAGDYPLSLPTSGILVDDLGHADDLPKGMRLVFDAVFGCDADRWWSDVVAHLDEGDHELRGWVAGSLFDYHLKRHSKSRRKAPILWQLGTQSCRYSVWLYAHRISSDSFFQLQNDVVGPKLNHEERQLTNLMQSAGDSPSASERKTIATQETLVDELRAMLEEIKRVAPLWSPNLDDGVVLTMAPLWRLVPQHKPWQQELKGKWDDLGDGKYDWAHLAMHLWPERVVPKCTTDRSIAIAHELEEVFWLEDFNNQWRAIQEPAQEREYVASQWARSPRANLLTQARDLWAVRYCNAGRIDSDWWHELEMGEHDDHPLALRLWPRRVCETALVDPVIAKSQELKLPKLSAFSEEESRPQIEAWLDKMSSRHEAAAIDRSFMSAAFGEAEPSREWKAWWSQLDGGQLDRLPLARYFRPEEVAKVCQATLDLANAHEVTRFFFIDTGSGLRKRLTPVEEILREVAERTSSAVKAALKSLLEAPGTVTRQKSARSRSRG